MIIERVFCGTKHQFMLVVWHISLLMVNTFNKTEDVIFSMLAMLLFTQIN